MLFKKKSIEKHLHEVLRKDWENVLDALFRNTIVNSVKGIGIICNTSREHPGAGEGIVQEELIYHIKQKRADEVKTKLKKLTLIISRKSLKITQREIKKGWIFIA